MNQIINLESFVSLSGDKLITDSRKVAKAFGKQHRNVLRNIRALLGNLSEKDALLNFEQCYESNELANGKPEPVYRITKNGLLWLVMGFTGKEALNIKVAYTKAFDTMADQLRNRDLNLWQQMHQLIALEVESKVRASFGSHLMLKRKKEKPLFEAKRTELGNVIQPSLLLN